MSHIILNIPHCSGIIPEEYRNDLRLTDEELESEISLLTDVDTDKLFTGYTSIIAEVSRLICDTERFLDANKEPMEKRGMGVVYTKTADGRPLREPDEKKRRYFIDKYYIPYHDRLNKAVASILEQYGKCLIIDCHSFSNEVPFIENGEDVCIGVDKYHTSEALSRYVINRFKSLGYTVEVNKPFAGAIVPMKYYKKDKRVESIMFEINKRIYTQSEEQFTGLKKIIDEILTELETTF